MPGLREVLRRVRARVVRYGREIVPGGRIGEALEIERLVCPLRYDILVRVDFIRLLRDEWALYADNLAEFLERPASRAYRVWFREIVCARFRPEIYPHEALVTPRFLERVHATARLWRSIERDGYDATKPIRLASGRSIRDVNGKRVAARFYAGDGCHRLACLAILGHTHLDPRHYEVELRLRYQPLDNTAVLIEALPLDRAAYLRFLSRFYCGGAGLESADEVRRHVAAEHPHLLPELESVLAFDLARV